MTRAHSLGGMLLVLASAGRPAGAAPVTFASLLRETVDRDRLARLPDPPFACRQCSSYDRASVAPDKPGWFANHDFEQFIRTETNQGRKEWVLMDADGPGALVRFWKGGQDPEKVLRIYLDGAEMPAIEERAEAFLGGATWVRPPLAAVRGRGFNLYLPIPFARHCKVTMDRLPDWYNIEYRAYAPGTPVQTFTRMEYEQARPLVEQVGQTLLMPGNSLPAGTKLTPAETRRLAPGGTLAAELAGPAAIRMLTVALQAEDLPQALRSTILEIECDGERTVWCPAGDFFGSGVGLNPYRSWVCEVDRSGMMRSWYVMPFGKHCRIALHNLGREAVTATLGMIGTGPWQWDARSMHFHAGWRQQTGIETKAQDGTMDWNFVEVAGEGVYLGDTLALHNGAANWWGEGDERIYVDGEAFPSHFGTGTEDYYGYSWGHPAFFEAPFHAQPRWEGNNRPGFTTNTRTRVLDAIPFRKSLKTDLEIWHWEKTRVTYAGTSYWYARPGAVANRLPEPEEARRAIAELEGAEAGAIEGEELRIAACTGGVTEVQQEGRWSRGRQLWWRDGKPGARLELALPVRKAGRYRIEMHNTRAFDYGIFQFTLDGQKLGGPVDLYSEKNVLQAVSLGTVTLTAGEHRFAAEIVGANPAAKARYMLGLDYLKLAPAE